MTERVLIAGAGRMGSWFAETLCLDYEVGVFDNETGTYVMTNIWQYHKSGWLQ